MAYEFDQADTLIYSDNPEALCVSVPTGRSPVHVATPLDAILYDVDVTAGRKRIFYYHQNFDDVPRTFGLRIVNLSATTAAIRTIAHVEPPVGDVIGVGHRSVAAFLRALIAGAWTATTLAAGADTITAVSTAAPGSLASAFIELDVPEGANLRIQVVSAAGPDGIQSVGVNGPAPGPGDGIGRSGVFDLTCAGTAHGDFAALTWEVGAARLEVEIPGQTVFPNSKIPSVMAGRLPSKAVYGLFTRRSITISNPTASQAQISVYLQACGGQTPATCMVNDDVIEVGTMESGAIATRPGYQLATFSVAAAASTHIDVLATVDPSGTGPLRVVIATAGALPAPSSARQVVYLPGEGWGA